MPDHTLVFENDINISVQIGDTAYYVDTTSVGGFDTNYTSTETVLEENPEANPIVEIGPIKSINHTTNTIICNADAGVTGAVVGQFILFSKDNAVNTSSPLGYYAQAKFVNNSTIKSEMFAAACGIFESSK